MLHVDAKWLSYSSFDHLLYTPVSYVTGESITLLMWRWIIVEHIFKCSTKSENVSLNETKSTYSNLLSFPRLYYIVRVFFLAQLHIWFLDSEVIEKTGDILLVVNFCIFRATCRKNTDADGIFLSTRGSLATSWGLTVFVTVIPRVSSY